jgi:hypothetical protein
MNNRRRGKLTTPISLTNQLNQQKRKNITMKTSIKILSVLSCACALTTSSAFAQLYTIDEFGNSSGPGIGPGLMQADPSGALTVPVLVYNLAFPVTIGDVVLTEPGQPSTGPWSDVIRFWEPVANGPGQVIFYSDVSPTDPADAPADTGLPTALIIAHPNPIFINEIGPEGNNGALYTPLPGDPGSISGVTAVQYNIISDVPEPNTVALVIAGAGLLLVTLNKRHQTNA